MEIDLDLLYKQIIKRDFKYAKVLKGNYIKLLLSSKNHELLTAEEIVNELKLYFNDFPDTYKIIFKVKPTDKAETMTVYDKVNAGDYTTITSSSTNSTNYHTETDIKKLREEIRNSLLADLVEEKRKDDLAKELLEQKRKTNELDTVAGKISYLLNAFLSNHLPVTGKLSGNTNLQTMVTTPKDLNQFTQEDKDKANEGLMRLLSVTNPDFLLHMATKLQEKPEMINTLKNFM